MTILFPLRKNRPSETSAIILLPVAPTLNAASVYCSKKGSGANSQAGSYSLGNQSYDRGGPAC
jgi:hypothetical protein